MTFTQSIRHCLSNYVTFRGRASRSEYWWFMLFVTLVGMVTIGLGLGVSIPAIEAMDAGAGLQAFPTMGYVFIGLGSVFYLAMLLPILAVTVRRFHDRNLSGWIYLAVFLAGMIPVVGWIASIAGLVITILKGTPGPNKFGADPLAPSASVFA